MFFSGSRACGFSVTALDASLSGHAKGTTRQQKTFSPTVVPQTQKVGGFHQGALLSFYLSCGHVLPLPTKAIVFVILD